MIVVWIVLAVVVIVLVWLVFAYNRLVRLRNEADQGYSSIDIQLKRRADLIPNLVETVKAYATHERGVFEDVAEARSKMLAARRRSARPPAAERQMRGALGRLFAVAEAYPELRASENFKRAPGGALRHRGQDRGRAALLQQRRPAVQHGRSSRSRRT